MIVVHDSLSVVQFHLTGNEVVELLMANDSARGLVIKEASVSALPWPVCVCVCVCVAPRCKPGRSAADVSDSCPLRLVVLSKPHDVAISVRKAAATVFTLRGAEAASVCAFCYASNGFCRL